MWSKFWANIMLPNVLNWNCHLLLLHRVHRNVQRNAIVDVRCSSIRVPFIFYVKFVTQNAAVRPHCRRTFYASTRSMCVINAAKCWVHLAAIVLIRPHMASISNSCVHIATKDSVRNHSSTITSSSIRKSAISHATFVAKSSFTNGRIACTFSGIQIRGHTSAHIAIKPTNIFHIWPCIGDRIRVSCQKRANVVINVLPARQSSRFIWSNIRVFIRIRVNYAVEAIWNDTSESSIASNHLIPHFFLFSIGFNFEFQIGRTYAQCARRQHNDSEQTTMRIQNDDSARVDACSGSWKGYIGFGIWYPKGKNLKTNIIESNSSKRKAVCEPSFHNCHFLHLSTNLCHFSLTFLMSLSLFT